MDFIFNLPSWSILLIVISICATGAVFITSKPYRILHLLIGTTFITFGFSLEVYYLKETESDKNQLYSVEINNHYEEGPIVYRSKSTITIDETDNEIIIRLEK